MQMEYLFDFHDTEDELSSDYGLTYDEVVEMILEHNENFDTGYNSIVEFNAGEEFYRITPSASVRLLDKFILNLN